MAAAERWARHRREIADLTLRDAMTIGSAQALALIPGVSRSGSTLATALILGMKRDEAARFSFLLSIPAVAAAGVYEMRQAASDLGQAGLLPLLVGTLVAGVVGYASIAWLIRFLGTRSTLPFVVYRVGLGIFLLAWLAVH
jgi:undecaprenyl-diphosphatase